MKPVAPVTSTVWRPGNFSTSPSQARCVMRAEPAHRREIPQAAERRADRRRRRDDAEQPDIGRLDAGRLHRPADQDRQQQHQDGAVIDREQRVIDPLARPAVSGS